MKVAFYENLFIAFFSNSLILVLIPMAADRFIAVAFPVKYSSIVTYKVSMAMVVLSWVPSVGVGLNDAVKFFLGKNRVSCVFYLFTSMSLVFCRQKLKLCYKM